MNKVAIHRALALALIENKGYKLDDRVDYFDEIE
jgi:hypothetical protein